MSLWSIVYASWVAIVVLVTVGLAILLVAVAAEGVRRHRAGLPPPEPIDVRRHGLSGVLGPGGALVFGAPRTLAVARVGAAMFTVGWLALMLEVAGGLLVAFLLLGLAGLRAAGAF